ncbi:MAG TPA: NrfD/PsrC family molybdoenzyme membrane anchor subunit [Frankiaceae bacterium]
MTDPSANGAATSDSPTPNGSRSPGGARPDWVTPGEGRRGGRRRSGRGRAEREMVPEAHFTSYYGRPVVKASPWEADIPAYLFLGGLAAGSSLLGAGATATGRETLRRSTHITAAGAIGLSLAALVHDLGRPMRFINMLRVAKPTSPMSVGTWLLVGYGPLAMLAGAGELTGLLPKGLRDGWVGGLVRALRTPAGLGAATIAPGVAAYTAVLLTDTATPTWFGARHYLPFVFVGSAAAASGGMGLIWAPTDEAGPALRLGAAGAISELAVATVMEKRMGLLAEPLEQGKPGRLMKLARAFTASGAAGAIASRRVPGVAGRVLAAVSGASLVAGSACLRFGIFEAGQASAHDPKYTVVPQRERLNAKLAAAERPAAQR